MHAHQSFVPAAILAVIVVTAVLIAGCSSYSSSPAPAVTSVASSSSSAGGNTVTIKNLAFTPVSITVKPGTTVTWTNMDDVAHTVTSTADSPVAFNSVTLQNGQTFQFTFTQAGTYPYMCSIHTFMKGTVTVAP